MVGVIWLRNILMTDLVHFCLNEQVNIRDCRVGDNPHSIKGQPLYAEKGAV